MSRRPALFAGRFDMNFPTRSRCRCWTKSRGWRWSQSANTIAGGSKTSGSTS